MRTLADFKRALSIGSNWRTYHHASKQHFPNGKVSKIGSNKVVFEREGKESSLYFPKSSNIEFNENGEISISQIHHCNRIQHCCIRLQFKQPQQ